MGIADKLATLPALARRRRRRLWERKWSGENPDAHWYKPDVRPCVRAAFEEGWIPAGASVVELGCGLGHTAAWLAEHGCDVVALDLSKAAVTRAKAIHAGVDGVEFLQADLTVPTQLRRTFDVVVDMGCAHGIPEPLLSGYGDNVRRLTTSGARLLYFMRALGAAHTVDEKVDALTRALGPDFEVERVDREVPDPDVSLREAAEVRLRRR